MDLSNKNELKSKMKAVKRLGAFVLVSGLLIFLFSNGLAAEDILRSIDDSLNINSFSILESEYSVGKYIDAPAFGSGFVQYDGEYLKKEKELKRRMYTFRSNFFLNNKLSIEDLSLYMTPRDYPYNVYINGTLLFKKGQYRKSYNSIQYGTSNIYLPKSLLNYGNVANKLVIQIYPKNEAQPFGEVTVLSTASGETMKFWRNLLNIHLIQASCIIGLCIALFLLIIDIGTTNKKMEYLYFSMVCFSYCLAYSNLFFHHDYSNELFLEIISRCGFPVTSMFLVLFTLEFTKLLNKKAFVKYLIIVPVIIAILITALQDSKEGVSTVFLYTIHLLITPHLIFSAVIILISIYKYEKKGSKNVVVLVSILTVIAAGMHDIYFVIYDIFPYCWTVPYGYLILIMGIFSAIATESVQIFTTNISLSNEIVNTQKEMIITLGEVVETRSKETAYHVKRVAEFSYLLAVNLDFDSHDANLFRLASPMHDIGKIGISDIILNKPGKLTSEEYDIIKSHTTIGHQLLKNSNREILKMASIVALQHHERWDGQGYPNGLKSDEIDIFGRITAVADNFDALTHSRIYKEAWKVDEVVDFFLKEKGKQFDPVIIDTFMNIVDDFVAINLKYQD